MKRGEVHWVKFALPDKRRPALILTRNSAILLLTRVTVAPITRTIRDIPSEVLLTPEDDGVPEICVVNTDNIQTIRKDNLDGFIAKLSNERMREITEAINFSLGPDADD
ncbi:MAG: type II toxin-antitoxin system PemK/MazF family toxin [Anaerolineales bacterium]|nr:type II toxin-antitoxin system PemK/MazF family toxin [Anaerolineales bacterium]